MTGKGRFAKWPIAEGPFEHPLRRLNVHALDHLVAEALGATVEGFDERLCSFDLGRAWGKSLMARHDLVRVNQALAVESEPPSFLRLVDEAVGVVEAVKNAVEGRDPGGTCGQYDHLQRG